MQKTKNHLDQASGIAQNLLQALSQLEYVCSPVMSVNAGAEALLTYHAALASLKALAGEGDCVAAADKEWPTAAYELSDSVTVWLNDEDSYVSSFSESLDIYRSQSTDEIVGIHFFRVNQHFFPGPEHLIGTV